MHIISTISIFRCRVMLHRVLPKLFYTRVRSEASCSTSVAGLRLCLDLYPLAIGHRYLISYIIIYLMGRLLWALSFWWSPRIDNEFVVHILRCFCRSQSRRCQSGISQQPLRSPFSVHSPRLFPPANAMKPRALSWVCLLLTIPLDREPLCSIYWV